MGDFLCPPVQTLRIYFFSSVLSTVPDALRRCLILLDFFQQRPFRISHMEDSHLLGFFHIM
jgi:predicted ATPase with chaperone activity